MGRTVQPVQQYYSQPPRQTQPTTPAPRQPTVQGIQGLPGKAATIEIGTVEEGGNASVINRGDSTNAVLDFIIPKALNGKDAVVDYEKLANDPALLAAIVKNLRIKVVFLDKDGMPSTLPGSEPQEISLDGGIIQIPPVHLRIYDGDKVFDNIKPLGQLIGIEVQGLLDAAKSTSKGEKIGATD